MIHMFQRLQGHNTRTKVMTSALLFHQVARRRGRPWKTMEDHLPRDSDSFFSMTQSVTFGMETMRWRCLNGCLMMILVSYHFNFFMYYDVSWCFMMLFDVFWCLCCLSLRKPPGRLGWSENCEHSTFWGSCTVRQFIDGGVSIPPWCGPQGRKQGFLLRVVSVCRRSINLYHTCTSASRERSWKEFGYKEMNKPIN